MALRVCFFQRLRLQGVKNQKSLGLYQKFTGINAGVNVLILSEKCAKTRLHAFVT
jgi:hypothetical protein